MRCDEFRTLTGINRPWAHCAKVEHSGGSSSRPVEVPDQRHRDQPLE